MAPRQPWLLIMMRLGLHLLGIKALEALGGHWLEKGETNLIYCAKYHCVDIEIIQIQKRPQNLQAKGDLHRRNQQRWMEGEAAKLHQDHQTRWELQDCQRKRSAAWRVTGRRQVVSAMHKCTCAVRSYQDGRGRQRREPGYSDSIRAVSRQVLKKKKRLVLLKRPGTAGVGKQSDCEVGDGSYRISGIAAFRVDALPLFRIRRLVNQLGSDISRSAELKVRRTGWSNWSGFWEEGRERMDL
ncbi:hypothetical protein BKA70DRAFT_1233546 [Coprinopsis sp. MPI-PUGE-AT-0042]|nr:hypothetical protein BKA70DRAFT_1233546 [Coprinopsis sp. MPI-PUGE-AT-0042]